MKKLNRTVALLCCTLFLLAAVPAALASEPSPLVSQDEPSFVKDVWGFVQAFFDNLAEVLPSDEEAPADTSDDETPLPPEDAGDDGMGPGTEAFPWPDPKG